MKRVAFFLFLMLLQLVSSASCMWTEEKLPPKLLKLTDQAYHYYSSRETDNFFESVRKVKDATEFSDYQETFYRACSYEAIYMFEYVDRKEGVKLAHAIYHHAKENNSNVGMFFATFTLGTIREQSGNMGLAEKSFLQALKLKEKYLLEESAAPCYLGLCETALHRKDYEEVKEYARKALDEPGIIPMNKITAWSYKCLARYNQGDSLGFEEAYKERAQLIAEHGGQGGLFGELINVYQAKNRKQWSLALQRADKLIHAAEHAVAGVVRALHRRGRGDRGNFADALRAVCDVEQLFLLHVDRVDIGDLVGAQQPQCAELRLRHAVL